MTQPVAARMPLPFKPAPGLTYMTSKNGRIAKSVDYTTVFTTGQVAAIVNVAPRTVTKWFAKGTLKGYRIPGSQDRRIPAKELRAFLEQHGIPVPKFLIPPPQLLSFGISQHRLPECATYCRTQIDFGVLAASCCRPDAVALGDNMGVSPMLEALTFIRNLNPDVRVILVISDDTVLPPNLDMNFIKVQRDDSPIECPPEIIRAMSHELPPDNVFALPPEPVTVESPSV